jgi:hypothetical protein
MLTTRHHDGNEALAMGAVESAIKAELEPGDVFSTLGRAATATVGSYEEAEVVLLVGQKRARNPVSWSCLEGVPLFLVGRDWVELTGEGSGGGTLATYLESHGSEAGANLVGALLEAAGVLEVDRDKPVRVRLLDAMSPSRTRQAPGEGGPAGALSRMVERPHRPHPLHPGGV